LRAPDGTFATFNYPGSPEASNGGGLVNDLGVVAGSFGTETGDVGTGYLRIPDGKITAYEAPGAGSAQYEGTYVYGLNVEGAVTGCLDDSNNVQHSFLRDPFGQFNEFDIPGQLLTPGSGGSCGETINAAGVVAGYWLDANNVFHGFLRLPY
jgi:hypothetical protein